VLRADPRKKFFGLAVETTAVNHSFTLLRKGGIRD